MSTNRLCTPSPQQQGDPARRKRVAFPLSVFLFDWDTIELSANPAEGVAGLPGRCTADLLNHY